MYTRNEIFHQLEAMGAPRDSVVMLHSSLRAIGRVEGGAEGLLDLLIEYFTGEGGLLCVPTHTWGNLGKPCPTLDLTVPESNLGAFPRLCAASPRGLRSENPTHSVVVFGDRRRAEAFFGKRGARFFAHCAGELLRKDLHSGGIRSACGSGSKQKTLVFTQ